MSTKLINTENFCNQCHAGINKYLGAYLQPVFKSETKVSCNCCGTVYKIKNSLADKFEEKYEIDLDAINQFRSFVESKLNNENVNTHSLIMPIIWSIFDETKDYLFNINKTIIYTNDSLFLNFGIHALAMAIGVKIHLQIATVANVHENIKSEINQHVPLETPNPFSALFLVNEFNESEILKFISPAEVTYLCVKDTRKKENKSLAYPKVFSLIS